MVLEVMVVDSFIEGEWIEKNKDWKLNFNKFNIEGLIKVKEVVKEMENERLYR